MRGARHHLEVMDTTLFFQIVGAVIGGNILTAFLAYMLWRAKRDEEAGGGGWNLPAGVYFLGALPLLVAAWAIWITG
jgi:hypothetical protein